VTDHTQTQTKEVEAVQTQIQMQASILAPSGVDPWRVLLAGDWHGNLGWALRVVDHAADVHAEVIVHVGDFGIWQGSAGMKYLRRLDQRLTERGLRLVFIDGNHENHDLLATYPVGADGTTPITATIRHLPRGHRWVWHGHIWLALGGATSLDRDVRVPWVDWWPGEAITAAQAARVIADGPVDIMLCHDAPAGVPRLEQRIGPNPQGFPAAALRSAHQHRMLLRAVVDAVRPCQLWHGHYHWAYRDELVLDGSHRVQVTGLDMDATTLEMNTAILDLDYAHLPRRFDMPL